MSDTGERVVGRDVMRGIAVGVLVLGLLGALAARAGWLAVEFPRAAGMTPWLVSRATGITALAALALDVVVGLLVSTRLGDRWIARGHLIELHGWLSPLALVLVVTHAGSLLADPYIRYDLIDVLIPFATPVRRFAVGLGVLSAYLALAVHASFGLRKWLGAKVWRRLHYLSFVALAAAAIHAAAAGTDAARWWAIALGGTPVAIAVALLVQRIASASGSRGR